MTGLALIAAAVLSMEDVADEPYLASSKVGVFASSARLSPAPFFGAELSHVLPVATRRVLVGAELGLSIPQTNGTLTNPDSDFTLQTTHTALTVMMGYRPDSLFGRFTPYGTLGPSIVFHTMKMTAFGSTNRESATRFGFALIAGWEYGLGPGGIFAEAQYRYAPVDFAVTGPVNAGGVVVNVGYRLKL